jgi:hypothetical protein
VNEPETTIAVNQSELLAVLRHAAEEVSQAARRRDEFIRKAKSAGISVPDIAAATGLARSRVYQILGQESPL